MVIMTMVSRVLKNQKAAYKILQVKRKAFLVLRYSANIAAANKKWPIKIPGKK